MKKRSSNPLSHTPARRLANPFPISQQLFKCAKCGDHKYLPDQRGSICKACFEKEKEKPIVRQTVINRDFAIFCPACRIPLLKAKRDISVGESMNPDDFETMTEHTRPQIGSRAVCGACNVNYVDPKTAMPYVIGVLEEKENPAKILAQGNDQVPEDISITEILPQSGNEIQNG